MPGRQAKILSQQQAAVLLAYASTTRYPARNRLVILLSVNAGLRAGEIAGLTWDMVVDATGEIAAVIEVRDCVAKKGSGRVIPTGLRPPTGRPASQAALRIWDDAPSSRALLAWFIRLGAPCATCSCWPVTGRSRPPNGTLIATAMPSDAWWR